jgi:hypothetical protein
MKTSLKIFALALVLVGFGMNVNAQVTNSADANATATVKKALTIVKVNNLAFGTFAGLNTEASTVAVATNNSRASSTSDIIGNDGAAATFTITGEPSSIIAITLPSSDIVVADLAGTDPGAAMSITSSSFITDAANNAAVTLTAGTGVVTLKVGATLNVGIAQKAGTYSGSFAVSVNYN